MCVVLGYAAAMSYDRGGSDVIQPRAAAARAYDRSAVLYVVCPAASPFHHPHAYVTWMNLEPYFENLPVYCMRLVQGLCLDPCCRDTATARTTRPHKEATMAMQIACAPLSF